MVLTVDHKTVDVKRPIRTEKVFIQYLMSDGKIFVTFVSEEEREEEEVMVVVVVNITESHQECN